MKSRPLILKTLLREIHIDTNSTTTAIITKLTNLDTYITSYGHYITKFNAHTKARIQSLIARGEIIRFLLANLFKGYKMISYQ